MSMPSFVALDRRSTLMALGAMALVASGHPSPTQARKAGKKAHKRCKRQGSGCRASLAPNCEMAPDLEACLETIGECCGLLGQCRAAAFLECLFPLP